MQLHVYLSFSGQCREAFELYEKALGGTIGMIMTNGESPMAGEIPPEWHDKIMHISMTIGAFVLMGSDAPPGHQEPMQGFNVSLQMTSAAESERVFNALSEGGKVTMPLGQTFWAHRFGMLVDRFGTPWMINCEHDA